LEAGFGGVMEEGKQEAIIEKDKRCLKFGTNSNRGKKSKNTALCVYCKTELTYYNSTEFIHPVHRAELSQSNV